jgi:hypothetical protein
VGVRQRSSRIESDSVEVALQRIEIACRERRQQV